MRLKEFKVFGLFGLFTHVIPINLEERITILHAPNGYGKTVVLKLISALFGGSLLVFREIEFQSIEYHFDDNSVLLVEQFSVDRSNLFDPSAKQSRRYTFSYIRGEEKLHWDPSSDNFKERPWREIPSSSWERYYPFLERVAAQQWLDKRTNEVIPIDLLYEKYGETMPLRRSKPTLQPEWLAELRKSVHCRLIETHRLLAVEKAKGAPGHELSNTLTVRTYSADLQNSVERLLAESATLSQSLDQTFPNRLLGRMAERTPPLSEQELRDRLFILEKQRLRLSNVGLLDTAKDDTMISSGHFNDATRRILSEYVEDAEKKLSIFDDMLQKIELFLDIINSRFQFKSISVSRVEGFYFEDFKGGSLNAESLSSGEQHELVIIYELLFRTRRNTLILIDEPEISLHIAWQKRFIQDLRRIIALTDLDALLSTHSPQLIGKDLSLAVQLQGPSSDLLN